MNFLKILAKYQSVVNFVLEQKTSESTLSKLFGERKKWFFKNLSNFI